MTEAQGPTGNYYDKYGSSNPIVRRMMAAFNRDVDTLLSSVSPSSLLDLGCGEGIVTERWAASQPEVQIVALDLEDAYLHDEWAKRQCPNLEFFVGNAKTLPFADSEFDVVSAIEMLEHEPEPELVLAEMRRVARAHLLVSVPREPLWRALNMVRGSYWRTWGSTPGHINHWSQHDFIRLCARYGRVEEVRTPLPWTVILISVR